MAVPQTLERASEPTRREYYCKAPSNEKATGSGFGESVHAPAFALHPDFEVVAIASPANAERVARERNIPRAFASLEALLHEVDVDFVSVASPPFDHHGTVLRAGGGQARVVRKAPSRSTSPRPKNSSRPRSARERPARWRTSFVTRPPKRRSKRS